MWGTYKTCFLKFNEQDFFVELERNNSPSLPSIYFSTDSINDSFTLFSSCDSLDPNFSEQVNEFSDEKVNSIQTQDSTLDEIPISFQILLPEKLEELSFEEKRLLFIQAKNNLLQR